MLHKWILNKEPSGSPVLLTDTSVCVTQTDFTRTRAPQATQVCVKEQGYIGKQTVHTWLLGAYPSFVSESDCALMCVSSTWSSHHFTIYRGMSIFPTAWVY